MDIILPSSETGDALEADRKVLIQDNCHALSKIKYTSMFYVCKDFYYLALVLWYQKNTIVLATPNDFCSFSEMMSSNNHQHYVRKIEIEIDIVTEQENSPVSWIDFFSSALVQKEFPCLKLLSINFHEIHQTFKAARLFYSAVAEQYPDLLQEMSDAMAISLQNAPFLISVHGLRCGTKVGELVKYQLLKCGSGPLGI